MAISWSSSGRSLRSGVLPAAEVEKLDDGDEVVVAGWPVARQHPRGREGTVFVTIEDETGDVQIILWPRVFARCRRELGSNVVEVTRRRIPVGRDDERHRLGPEGHSLRRHDAARARLALTPCDERRHGGPYSSEEATMRLRCAEDTAS